MPQGWSEADAGKKEAMGAEYAGTPKLERYGNVVCWDTVLS